MKKNDLTSINEVIDFLNNFMFDYQLSAKQIAANSTWNECRLSEFKGGADPL